MPLRRISRLAVAPQRRYMRARPSDDLLPNPCDADLYVRYVEICRRAGVEPSSPQRVHELVGNWNAVLSGERSERDDAAED